MQLPRIGSVPRNLCPSTPQFFPNLCLTVVKLLRNKRAFFFFFLSASLLACPCALPAALPASCCNRIIQVYRRAVAATPTFSFRLRLCLRLCRRLLRRVIRLHMRSSICGSSHRLLLFTDAETFFSRLHTAHGDLSQTGDAKLLAKT